MTAQEILKLIEEVSPDDTAKLDEIDAMVLDYINDHRVIHRWNGGVKYSRSRDALKAIRPEGCFVSIQDCGLNLEWFIASVFEDDNFPQINTKKLPTEELAELSAIIQAIEYERNNA